MRFVLAVVATFATLVFPTAARAAPGGSITNVYYRALDGVVVATFTAASDVPDRLWFASGWQQPLDAGPCSRTWSNHSIYHGDGGDGPGTTTERDYFYPDDAFPNGGRICLSVYVDGDDHIVAETTWTKPPPRPGIKLSRPEAKRVAQAALTARYATYRRGRNSSISCARLSDSQRRCRARWRHRSRSYQRFVYVTEREAGYRTRIRSR